MKGKPTSIVRSTNASMKVRRGEFYCLLGPSGCGKSTILNLIAGLHARFRIIRMDRRAADHRCREPNASWFFRMPRMPCFPGCERIENVEFGLTVQGLLKRQRRPSAAMDYLDLVGLRDHAHKFPYELSGGMKQRCQLARALVLEPEVLLMDEPFAALDAISKRIMQKELLRIWRQFGMTVVYITHDVSEAVLLGQRVAVMRRGPGSSDQGGVRDRSSPIHAGPPTMLQRTSMRAVEASLEARSRSHRFMPANVARHLAAALPLPRFRYRIVIVRVGIVRALFCLSGSGALSVGHVRRPRPR